MCLKSLRNSIWTTYCRIVPTSCRVSHPSWCLEWRLPALFPALGLWLEDIIQGFLVCDTKSMSIFRLWTYLKSLSLPVSTTFWSCSFQDFNHPSNPLGLGMCGHSPQFGIGVLGNVWMHNSAPLSFQAELVYQEDFPCPVVFQATSEWRCVTPQDLLVGCTHRCCWNQSESQTLSFPIVI